MGKHKKKVREEKSKTKLKGAKLVKGLNITKTDFKVKRIVIREQLRSNDDEIHSSRHLKVKECVTKLGHYNSSMRLDGLSNLKEIVVKYFDEVVKNHLNEIILSLLKLSVDIENNIRSETYKLLQAIISTAPATSIKPFYDVICSYTRCAMSHIKPKIQEDSLILLDIIIDHIPDLVIAYFQTIFQCFLDILSKQKNGLTNQRVMLSDVTRTDIISRWRIKIFERIYKMLLAYNSEIFSGNTKHNSSKNYIFETNFIFDENILYRRLNKGNRNHRNSMTYLNGSNHIPIIDYLKSNRYTFLRKNSMRNSMFAARQLGAVGNIDKDEFIGTIMSLLFEAWAEVKPDATDKSHLSLDAESTLNLVILIMEHLWNVSVYWDEQDNSCYMMDLFRTKYFKEFTLKIFSGFPFQSSDKPGKRAKGYMKPELNCTVLNFKIGSIYIILLDEIRKNELENLKSVLQYVNGTISDENLNFTQTSIILKISKLILNPKNLNFLRNDTEIKSLVGNMILMATKYVHINDEILMLLSEISLNDKFVKYFGCDMLNDFVRGLPDLLCQPRINVQILSQYSKFGIQNNIVFLEKFLLNTDKILNNLDDIEIIDINDQFEGKKLIMNLFYWIDGSTKVQLEEKADALIKDDNTKDYLKSVLKY